MLALVKHLAPAVQANTPVLSITFCLLYTKHPVFYLNAPGQKTEITSEIFDGTKE